jgi:hypothetical protein
MLGYYSWVHLRCPLNFFIVVSIYWKPSSYRSSLDLSTIGKITNRSATKQICLFLFFGPTCMLFDLSIALWLRHDLSMVAAPTPRSGLWDMGTTGSPPTRFTVIPDKWVRPTRRPVDLSVGPIDLVGSPHDLLKTFQKIPRWPNPLRPQDLAYKTKTSVNFAQSRSTGYGKMCNVDLGLLVVTDQELGNRPYPLANIRRTRRPFVTSRNPQAIYTNN